MEKKPLKPLSAAALELLPPAEESVKCSVHTAALGVNPAGTGISATMVVLVDTPQPWPKPVFEHTHLTGVTGQLSNASGQVMRVFASVPSSATNLGVTVFSQTAAGAEGTWIPLGSRTPAEIVSALLDQRPLDIPDAVGVTDTAILVCTQGTHDVCCGTEGSALVSQLTEDQRFAGVPIFRVSHTGGHRFAPTAITFPDGRTWAYVGPDQLATALFHTQPPSAVAPWCRGSWRAPTPRSQAAESAVFAQRDWTSSKPTFRELSDDVIEVSSDDQTDRVRVTVSREIPVIRCRAAGGLPAKPSLEFRAEVL
ncbi:MAG: hypothetical protein HKN03_14095 [Acidimicrobiales bacterium]|nr:hypothetical protein [Acidimicrobiales bacterium]